MLGHTINALVAFFAALLVGGCGSSPIFKTADLDQLKIVTTGAKQRAILNTKISPSSKPGLVDPNRMTCTEPSPDVASAVANTFASSLSVTGQGAGSFSGSHVEALAQLVDRTASIQLLRDKMYQTCLAYANGAISGTIYSLVMTQLDKTIVSLLLGETAAGRFGGSLAALGTETEGEATATLIGLPSGVADLQGLTDELKTAQADVENKEATMVDKKKLAEGKPENSDEAKAVQTADDELTAARAKRDELLKRLQSRADTLAKSGGKAATVKAAGGISNEGGPASADILLAMQKEFLSEGVTDFIVTACFTELALSREIPEKGPTKSALADFCNAHLPQSVRSILANEQILAIKRIAANKFAEERNLERARAARHASFTKALGACEQLQQPKVKEACIATVVGLPAKKEG